MGEAPTPAASEAPAPSAADQLYAPAAEPAVVETPAVPPVVEPEAAPAAEEPKEGEAPAPLDLKLPDGFQVDEATMTAFQDVLQNADMSPKERGEKLLEMYVAQQTAAQDSWQSTITEWQTALDSDPQFSGDNAAKAQATIAKALDTYGSPEARQAFDLTGAGWNPHIVKFIHSMAASLAEGTQVPAGNPAPKGPQTAGSVLYPQTAT